MRWGSGELWVPGSWFDSRPRNWRLRTSTWMHHAGIPEMATVSTTLSANAVQPPFLSGHVLGGSQPDNGAACTPKNPRTHIPQLGRKPSSQNTKGDKKAMAVPEREQVNNQWVPESKFTRRHSIQTKFNKYICLPTESGKKWTTWSFPSLPPRGPTEI